MNLTEAFDAALPEIPKTRLARSRPPCLDPDLVVRDDVLDGEPIVGVFQTDGSNYYRFPPQQWQLILLFNGERSYEEIAAEFELKALPSPTNQANYGYRSIDWLGCTVPCSEAASSFASPVRPALPHRSIVRHDRSSGR